jgi:hypothetical protein
MELNECRVQIGLTVNGCVEDPEHTPIPGWNWKCEHVRAPIRLFDVSKAETEPARRIREALEKYIQERSVKKR